MGHDPFNIIIRELETKSATGLFTMWLTVLVLVILNWLILPISSSVMSGIVTVGVTAFVLWLVPNVVLRYQLPTELTTLNGDEARYLLESVQTKTRTRNHRLNNSVTISLEEKGFLIRKNVKESTKMVPCTIRRLAWSVITKKKHRKALEKRVAETVIPEFEVK